MCTTARYSLPSVSAPLLINRLFSVVFCSGTISLLSCPLPLYFLPLHLLHLHPRPAGITLGWSREQRRQCECALLSICLSSCLKRQPRSFCIAIVSPSLWIHLFCNIMLLLLLFLRKIKNNNSTLLTLCNRVPLFISVSLSFNGFHFNYFMNALENYPLWKHCPNYIQTYFQGILLLGNDGG